jgi:hypothetical protein
MMVDSSQVAAETGGLGCIQGPKPAWSESFAINGRHYGPFLIVRKTTPFASLPETHSIAGIRVSMPHRQYVPPFCVHAAETANGDHEPEI